MSDEQKSGNDKDTSNNDKASDKEVVDDKSRLPPQDEDVRKDSPSGSSDEKRVKGDVSKDAADDGPKVSHVGAGAVVDLDDGTTLYVDSKLTRHGRF